MSTIQDIPQRPRRDPLQGVGQSPAQEVVSQPAPRPRGLVDDIAIAVDRLRRIEGERGLYNMLEMLLGDSRKVLVDHGVVPPLPADAEKESLHAQLKRMQASRDNAHAYATHYANVLSEIVNLDGALVSEAPAIAKKALQVVFENKA